MIISFKSLLKIDHFRAIGKLFRIIFPIFMVKNQNACVENSISWKNKKKCQKKNKMSSKNCSIQFSSHKKLLLYVNFDPTRGFLDWIKIWPDFIFFDIFFRVPLFLRKMKKLSVFQLKFSIIIIQIQI